MASKNNDFVVSFILENNEFEAIMTFKRKIYDKFLTWKETSNGNSALLVEGARRIGKSTIVEEFGKNEYRTYILIDFTKVSDSVKALFDDLSDLNYLFLQLHTGQYFPGLRLDMVSLSFRFWQW